ncbi:hypothetical protein AD998_17775 [bacterium 336/3]|nr:hypothetical protein AD998_17775 [bacterium 336/3]
MQMKTSLLVLGLLLCFAGFGQKKLVPKEKKGKWGYVKEGTEKFAIKAKYDYTKPFDEVVGSERALVKQKGKWGIIDTKGKFVLAPQYDTIFESKRKNGSFKIARIEKAKWFINTEGKIVSPEFADYADIGEKWVMISKEDKFGMLAKNGDTYEETIPMQYKRIGLIGKNVFALVGANSVSFYNNETKKTSESYDKHQVLNIPSNPLIHVIKDKKDGIIDRNFNILLPLEYNAIRMDKNRREKTAFITVRKEGLEGRMDTTAKWILPVEFTSIRTDNNYFIGKKDSLSGVYDFSGKQILPPQYTEITIWGKSSLLVVKKMGKSGILDMEGNIILPLLYARIQILEQKENKVYFKTYNNNKVIAWKIENKTASKINTQEYDELTYANERFLVSKGIDKNVKKGLIDETGKTITPIQYEELYYFKPQLFFAKLKGKEGLIDPDGKVILPLEYDVLRNDGSKKAYLEKGEKAFLWNIEEKTLTPTEKKAENKKDKELKIPFKEKKKKRQH